MTLDPDPYRTLGLSRGAPMAEVKRAYRRLAKANHPDAAGEAALPRFLAIQAAYDQIVGGPSVGGATGRAAPKRPWDADPTRADATHRAYGGRTRRERPAGTGRSGRTAGTAGTAGTRPPGSTGPNAAGHGPPGADGSAGADPGSPGDGAPAQPPKATLGSTSYDGADAGPFEPDWGGASWYGSASGTYWTLNPKEYADPRKHGPEYQARARRAAAAERGTNGPESVTGTGTGPASSAAHTTGSWWDATAAAPAEEEPVAAPPDAPDPDVAGEAAGGSDMPSGPPEPPATETAAVSQASWAWLEGDRPGVAARVVRAVIAWVPLALAIGGLSAEVTGCGRFAADCDPSVGIVARVLQVLLLVALLAVPRLASIAAIAALVAILVAIPATLILATPGAEGVPANASPALFVVVAVAWLAGLAIGVARLVRRGREPVS